MADHEERRKAIFGALELSKDSPLRQSPRNSAPAQERLHNTKTRDSSSRKHDRIGSSPRSYGRQHKGEKWHSKRGKRTPGYVLHPDRWTKYDLSDDRASKDTRDMNDEQRNTFAAMSFIRELHERRGDHVSREDEKTAPEDGNLDSKPVFKKPPASTMDVPRSDGTESCGGSGSGKLKSTWNHALVMPEYVVGSKVKRKKRKLNVVGSSTEGESGEGDEDSCHAGLDLFQEDPCDVEDVECPSHATDEPISDSKQSSESHDEHMITDVKSHDSHVYPSPSTVEDSAIVKSSVGGVKVGFKKFSSGRKQSLRQSKRQHEQD